ncbi:MAG: hypothetical protein V7L26_31375 [Nostoc sp.]|uniref:hypothetical protein n=1 Tax=Nostoc sp. TaxID=1180 RepID=UPI002FF46E99
MSIVETAIYRVSCLNRTVLGGMGLAGGFGAVGIGTAPVVGAGAVAGAAAYGAFKAIAEGDAAAFVTISFWV